MRLYEFTKKFGFTNKQVLELLQENNFEIASHMALLSPEAYAFLEKKLLQQQESKSLSRAEQSPISTVAQPTTTPQKPTQSTEKKMEKQPMLEKQIVQPTVVLSGTTVEDVARQINKPVNEVILTLLRNGVVATKNQQISEKVVAQLARLYNIPTKAPAEPHKAEAKEVTKVVSGKDTRPPVVVIIGHVDHGKTTLLDYIRKTRVAAKEKGGITQHIGAYEAQTPQGAITFLDTPGHEAFSMIRVRGLRVADIAILVVAADDGIMPQTLEAIRAAKQAQIPLIVAINKIDKATPAQIEAVKRGLAQHDLLSEEWGGQTIVLPISAKNGTGITELLEVIILQSQLMELTTTTSAPAKGFILESRIEKGRGPVATVIAQQGTLSVGDYFISGQTRGKISSLVNYAGKRIERALPSMPVSVAGFDALPEIGEFFEIVTAEEYKNRPTARVEHVKSRQSSQEAINIVLKTDTISSKEALLQAVQKLSGKAFKELNVVSSHIGAITENDVLFASDTNSTIYGLHAKIEPNALTLAKKLDVTVKLFDIIYKMLEDLQDLAEQGKPIKKTWKKIGEAVVLKVFDIKNLGIIAGGQVKSGRFVRDGKVVVWRGKHKVGEGSIQSLQRDRKTVKEVHTGFECAFMVDGFTEWQVDDRVECLQEVEAT